MGDVGSVIMGGNSVFVTTGDSVAATNGIDSACGVDICPGGVGCMDTGDLERGVEIGVVRGDGGDGICCEGGGGICSDDVGGGGGVGDGDT